MNVNILIIMISLLKILILIMIRSKNKEIRTELGFRTPITKKKYEPIDFSTFRQYLYLRDNDFLYAKRVGGPVDFALCSYKDINKNFKQNSFKTNMFSKGYINKNCEYLTISKNTILHYQKGIPQIYTISDWTNNYINACSPFTFGTILFEDICFSSSALISKDNYFN